MTTPNSRVGLELFWFNIPGAQRELRQQTAQPPRTRSNHCDHCTMTTAKGLGIWWDKKALDGTHIPMLFFCVWDVQLNQASTYFGS
jgi:hypothetical protein